MFSPIRPSIKLLAGSMLNRMKYRLQMLNGEKTTEIRLWEKKKKPQRVKFTHVMFRMIKRFRKRGVRSNVMATLDKRLGPFSDAAAAVAAAKEWKMELGMTEEELHKFMLRPRKVRSGVNKGKIEKRVIPIALFQLLDVHDNYDLEWSDGPWNQAGFLCHEYQPDGATHKEKRFWYADGASSSASVLEDTSVAVAPIVCAAAPMASPSPIAVQRAAIEPCAPAPVAVLEPASGVARSRQVGTWNGRRRLGRAPIKAGSRDAAAFAAAARKMRDAAAMSEDVIVIE